LTEANPILALKIIWGITLLWFGLLVDALSYPLIRGSVKMNHLYGVRFPQSFYSEESWYKINAYGGKVLTIWGLFLVATGILIIFIPLDSRAALFAMFIGAYATIIVPIIIIFNYARRFKRQPAESVKGGI
jgi:hypothetical protein